MRSLCVIATLLSLWSVAKGQSQTKHLGIRSGINVSSLQVMSAEFDGIAKLGGRLGAFYTENYFSTGFDLETMFGLRRSGLDSLRPKINFPQIGIAGRFRFYTSPRKKLSFHVGYQLIYNFVEEDSGMEPLITEPSLGAAYSLSDRLQVEFSAFLPASKSGKVKWQTLKTIESEQKNVESKENVYLFSALLSVSYRFYELY